MSPKKPRGGYARVKAKGLRSFNFAVTEEQRETLRKAAELDGRSVTQFLIFHSLEAAKKIISKNPET